MKLIVGVVIWIAVALTLAVSGALAKVPPLGVAFAIASVATWIALYRNHAGIRAAVDRLPVRGVIAAHAIRAAIGALFLVELSRGHLPAAFAERAGTGDVAIGLAAIVVALVPRRPRLYLVWSVLGLADIAIAIVTAQYLVLGRHDAQMMAAIGRMPYPLLPLVIVPAVALTHLLVIGRSIRRSGR